MGIDITRELENHNSSHVFKSDLKGTAITLVLKDQISIMSRIEAVVNRKIRQRNLPQRPRPPHGKRSSREHRNVEKPKRRNFLY